MIFECSFGQGLMKQAHGFIVDLLRYNLAKNEEIDSYFCYLKIALKMVKNQPLNEVKLG